MIKNMVANKVSIIMPFCNEWPQIVFTVRTVKEMVENFMDFEIVVVDNYCQEVEEQGIFPDRGHSRWILNKKTLKRYSQHHEEAKFNIGHMEAQAKQHSWLKYVQYDEKLSHWNAKNKGVEASDGEILLFLDAHVVPSRNIIPDAVKAYESDLPNTNLATLHLPLSYHIMENKRLMYKLIYDADKGLAHYSFTSMPDVDEIIEVPCMSTCGMIMWRKIYDSLGGWPEGFGIYGGGENFINFVCAIVGIRKYVYPNGCLHHHGDKRDYSYNWADYHRNRLLATICYGGANMAEKYLDALGRNATTQRMYKQAFASYEEHRDKMEVFTRPIVSLDEWVKEWEGCRAIGVRSKTRYR